jgi:hypothetical protein
MGRQQRVFHGQHNRLEARATEGPQHIQWRSPHGSSRGRAAAEGFDRGTRGAARSGRKELTHEPLPLPLVSARLEATEAAAAA